MANGVLPPDISEPESSEIAPAEKSNMDTAKAELAKIRVSSLVPGFTRDPVGIAKNIQAVIDKHKLNFPNQKDEDIFQNLMGEVNKQQDQKHVVNAEMWAKIYQSPPKHYQEWVDQITCTDATSLLVSMVKSVGGVAAVAKDQSFAALAAIFEKETIRQHQLNKEKKAIELLTEKGQPIGELAAKDPNIAKIDLDGAADGLRNNASRPVDAARPPLTPDPIRAASTDGKGKEAEGKGGAFL